MKKQPTLEEMKKLVFSAMGKRGGKARAKALSPEQRRIIAKKAAQARWGRSRRKPSS